VVGEVVGAAEIAGRRAIVRRERRLGRCMVCFVGRRFAVILIIIIDARETCSM
jgi:hypothetical protein